MTGTAHRRSSIVGWCLYDWANSAYSTVMLTFVFSVYFAKGVVGDEAEGSGMWGFAIGAAGLAVANEFKTNNLLDNVNARGEQLSASLGKVMEKYPDVIEEIRGMGLIVGAKIHDAHKASAQDITLDLIDEGLLVVPAGPKVVRFVPPLIISESEIDTVVSKFEASSKKIVAT